MSSHIDHHSAAASRGSAAMAHVGHDSGELYQHVVARTADGQVTNFPVSQHRTLHASTHTTVFTPTTALPDISTASQVDVRIPAGSCGAVTGLAIRLDLSNDTAGTSTFYGAIRLFDRIELWAESGSVLVQRWTADELATCLHYLSREASSRYVYTTGTQTLVAGASRTVYVRLPFSVFESSHMNLGGLQSDIYVRCFFRGADSYLTADTVTLNALQVVADWLAKPPSIQRQLVDRMRSQTLDYRYWASQTQKEVVTMAPSTRYQIRLSSMHGIVSDIAVIVRPAGHTGAASAGGFVQPAVYELIDAGGKSILSGASFPFEFNGYQKQQQGLLSAWGPELSNLDDTLLIPLSPDPKTTLSAAVVAGYIVGTGYESIALTMGSSLAAGQYEVTVIWHRAERLRLDGGHVTVHAS